MSSLGAIATSAIFAIIALISLSSLTSIILLNYNLLKDPLTIISEKKAVSESSRYFRSQSSRITVA